MEEQKWLRKGGRLHLCMTTEVSEGEGKAKEGSVVRE